MPDRVVTDEQSSISAYCFYSPNAEILCKVLVITMEYELQ